MRPDIDIVIPVQAENAELEQVVQAIQHYTTGYRLSIEQEPTLNVSECRQAAMDRLDGRFLCFMDGDAHHLQAGWLDEMHRVLTTAPDATVVFAGEQWGTDPAPEMCDPAPEKPWQAVPYGPAACMLIDRERLPAGVQWNAKLGLANGWLGGDFEEVEYCRQITAQGGKLYRATRTLFHHQGGRKTMKDFCTTDRFRVIRIIEALLNSVDTRAPGWWDNLQRVPAAPDDDLSFHPAVTNPLRTIFRNLLLGHGYTNVPIFRRWGILD